MQYIRENNIEFCQLWNKDDFLKSKSNSLHIKVEENKRKKKYCAPGSYRSYYLQHGRFEDTGHRK